MSKLFVNMHCSSNWMTRGGWYAVQARYHREEGGSGHEEQPADYNQDCARDWRGPSLSPNRRGDVSLIASLLSLFSSILSLLSSVVALLSYHFSRLFFIGDIWEFKFTSRWDLRFRNTLFMHGWLRGAIRSWCEQWRVAILVKIDCGVRKPVDALSTSIDICTSKHPPNTLLCP